MPCCATHEAQHITETSSHIPLVSSFFFFHIPFSTDFPLNAPLFSTLLDGEITQLSNNWHAELNSRARSGFIFNPSTQ